MADCARRCREYATLSRRGSLCCAKRVVDGQFAATVSIQIPYLDLYGQRVYNSKQMHGSKGMPFDWGQANADHIARHGVTPTVVFGASLPIETEDRGGAERHTELA